MRRAARGKVPAGAAATAPPAKPRQARGRRQQGLNDVPAALALDPIEAEAEEEARRVKPRVDLPGPSRTEPLPLLQTDADDDVDSFLHDALGDDDGDGEVQAARKPSTTRGQGDKENIPATNAAPRRVPGGAPIVPLALPAPPAAVAPAPVKEPINAAACRKDARAARMALAVAQQEPTAVQKYPTPVKPVPPSFYDLPADLPNDMKMTLHEGNLKIYCLEMDAWKLKESHKQDMEKQSRLPVPPTASAAKVISPPSGHSNTVMTQEPPPAGNDHPYFLRYNDVAGAVGQFVSRLIKSTSADADLLLPAEAAGALFRDSPELASFRSSFDQDGAFFTSFWAYNSKKLPIRERNSALGGAELYEKRMSQQLGKRSTDLWQQYQRSSGQTPCTTKALEMHVHAHRAWCGTMSASPTAYRSIRTPVDHPALGAAVAAAFNFKIHEDKAVGVNTVTLQQLAFVCFKVWNRLQDPFGELNKGQSHASKITEMMVTLDDECSRLPGGWHDVKTFIVVGKNDTVDAAGL